MNKNCLLVGRLLWYGKLKTSLLLPN